MGSHRLPAPRPTCLHRWGQVRREDAQPGKRRGSGQLIWVLAQKGLCRWGKEVAGARLLCPRLAEHALSHRVQDWMTLRSSGGSVPETDSAVCPWLGGAPTGQPWERGGHRCPPRCPPGAHPAGTGLQSGMCGKGSLQANRATMGPLSNFQNKGDTDLTVAQRAAAVGVAAACPSLRPGLSAPCPLGLGARFQSPHIRFPSIKVTISHLTRPTGLVMRTWEPQCGWGTVCSQHLSHQGLWAGQWPREGQALQGRSQQAALSTLPAESPPLPPAVWEVP